MNNSAAHSRLLAEILIALGKIEGVTVWRRNVGLFLTPDGKRKVVIGIPGQADICGIVAPLGRHFEIEVKTGSGIQRENQARWEVIMAKRGALYVVARSVEDATNAVIDYMQESV